MGALTKPRIAVKIMPQQQKSNLARFVKSTRDICD